MSTPEQQAAPVQADLRQRIATALRDAAHDCDGDCGLAEEQCFEQHPIQVSVLHFDQIAGVYGDIDALAEVAAGTVQPELAALREQLAAAQAENERLRAEQAMAVSVARAAGYRLAADNAAEQRQLHGADADAEMLVLVLQQVAGLHERAATDPAFIAATTPRPSV